MISSNVEEVKIFYKELEEVTATVLVLFEDEQFRLHPSQLDVIYDKVRHIFADKGYPRADILTLISSTDLDRAKELAAGIRGCWFYDKNQDRVIIYEEQPGKFYDLHAVINEITKERRGETENHTIRPADGKRRRVRYLGKAPLVTLALALINVLIFIWMELHGSTLSTIYMVQWGAAVPQLIVYNHEYYRLFTAMFLHFGIEHLTNNMFILIVMGSRLENIIGRVKFIIIYLIGGLAASCLSLFAELRSGANYVSAGASGAIYAVIGAMLFIVIINRGRIRDISRRGLIFMVCVSLYHGFTSTGVDNFAHLGGLIGGFLLAIPLYRRNRKIKHNI